MNVLEAGFINEKILITALAATMLFGTTSLKTYASENNNIFVGDVDNAVSTQQVNFAKRERQYNLDFSCIKVKIKNKKLVTEYDKDKLSKVSYARNFNTSQKNNLL